MNLPASVVRDRSSLVATSYYLSPPLARASASQQYYALDHPVDDRGRNSGGIRSPPQPSWARLNYVRRNELKMARSITFPFVVFR